MRIPACALLLSLATSANAYTADTLPPPWLPGDPGKATCRITRDGGELANAALRFAVVEKDGSLVPAAFDNRYPGAGRALEGALFALTARGVKPAPAQKIRFKLDGRIACVPLKPQAQAVRAAERDAGVALAARFVDAATGI